MTCERSLTTTASFARFFAPAASARLPAVLARSRAQIRAALISPRSLVLVLRQRALVGAARGGVAAREARERGLDLRRAHLPQRARHARAAQCGGVLLGLVGGRLAVGERADRGEVQPARGGGDRPVDELRRRIRRVAGLEHDRLGRRARGLEALGVGGRHVDVVGLVEEQHVGADRRRERHGRPWRERLRRRAEEPRHLVGDELAPARPARLRVGLVEREVRRRAEADDAVDRLQAGRGDEREMRSGGLAVDAHRPAAAAAAELLADRVEDVAQAGLALLVVDRDDAPAACDEDVAGMLEEDALGVGVVAGPAAGVDHDDRALDVAVGGLARDRVGDRRDGGRRRRWRGEQTRQPQPRLRFGSGAQRDDEQREQERKP